MNALQQVTKRMLEIENANMIYNKQTDFGNNPNGEKKKIEELLLEWDKLKAERTLLKQPH